MLILNMLKKAALNIPQVTSLILGGDRPTNLFVWVLRSVTKSFGLRRVLWTWQMFGFHRRWGISWTIDCFVSEFLVNSGQISLLSFWNTSVLKCLAVSLHSQFWY